MKMDRMMAPSVCLVGSGVWTVNGGKAECRRMERRKSIVRKCSDSDLMRFSFGFGFGFERVIFG